MIAAAEKFKQHDREFSEKHQAKQELEAYVATVEQTISSPDAGARMKRGAKSAVESQLASALEKLEIEDATADEYVARSIFMLGLFTNLTRFDRLKRVHLGLRRALQKALTAR